VIALTFDACGGPGGSGYDRALIDFLRRREIPATLFINSRWIDANPAIFRRLAAEPLFEIANHGTRHRPLSVTGRSAYGIPGTRSAAEVYDEISASSGPAPPTATTSRHGSSPPWENASSASRSTATAAPPSPPNRSVRRSPPPPADPSSSAT
jgi:peptidoglycan/xylan/chitin deacetylase (PgdA/CDA1 family)